LDEQLVVYDPRDDRVHLLDATTASVLELLEESVSDASRLPSDVARRLGTSATPELVDLAIDELRRADLLDPVQHSPIPLTEISRREILRKVAAAGMAALLIPAIVTLTPDSAYAQSNCTASTGRGIGCPCQQNTQCASGLCGGNTPTGQNVCV